MKFTTLLSHSFLPVGNDLNVCLWPTCLGAYGCIFRDMPIISLAYVLVRCEMNSVVPLHQWAVTCLTASCLISAASKLKKRMLLVTNSSLAAYFYNIYLPKGQFILILKWLDCCYLIVTETYITVPKSKVISINLYLNLMQQEWYILWRPMQFQFNNIQMCEWKCQINIINWIYNYNRNQN